MLSGGFDSLSHPLIIFLLFQDTQTKIRIHGSRKKGVIIQSDMVASNGMIHIINKLMDSVSPTVESDPEVQELFLCKVYWWRELMRPY